MLRRLVAPHHTHLTLLYVWVCVYVCVYVFVCVRVSVYAFI